VLALACALERRSAHPLAQAIVTAAAARGVGEQYPAAEEVQALAGRGIQGLVNGKRAHIGSHSLFETELPHAAEVCRWVEAAEDEGLTAMLVHDGERVVGYIAVADEVRPESRDAIAALHQMGRKTALLTGDNAVIARRVGQALGITDIRAGLLPDQKVQAVEVLRESHGTAAMVGDGINDAPALAAANLGITLGGASSAQALETADVVLMGDDLSALPFAVGLSAFAGRLVRQNIAISLLTKAVFILLALLGVATLWMAVLADMGVSLLVTANGLRALGWRRNESIKL